MLPPNKPISGLDDEKRVNANDGGGRPSRSPKRDFRKVTERDSKGESEDDKQNVKQKEDTDEKESVFELAGNTIKGKKRQSKEDSLFALAGEQGAAQKGAVEKGRVLVETEAADDLAGLTKSSKEGDKPSVAKGKEFGQAREDLSVVNPNALLGKEAQLEGVNLNAGPQTTQKTDLYTLVEQISSKLYTVKMGDVTDTVLTIKNPPVFAGSELTVTSYNSARGEFNIAFSGLTQEGKALLDSQQAKLMQALEERGYIAHIVITSTEPREITLAKADQSELGKQREDQEEQEDSQRDQRQQ